jgi:hypothetical protein
MDFSLSTKQAIWVCAIALIASNIYFAAIELATYHGEWEAISGVVVANVVGIVLLHLFAKGKILNG